MRGLRPVVYALAVQTLTPNPLIRRYGATFSQSEKEELLTVRQFVHDLMIARIIFSWLASAAGISATKRPSFMT